MQTLLFQVSPIDPVSLAGVALIFLSVAFLACFVPAWRVRASTRWRRFGAE